MTNQTGLPGNLYGGDAVVLNTDKYTNYYLQKAAQQKAKNEALDKYYNDLHANINPNGMRTQDIEGGFNKDINDWRQHYIDNADKIKNPKLDNGRAYNEHMSKYQQLQSRIQESKNAATQEAEVAKQKLLGKYMPTDDDMGVLHGIGASIYSPEHYLDPESRIQPYGLEHLSTNIPEFDVKRQASFLKGATNGFPVKPQYDDANKRVDIKNGRQYTPIFHEYKPEELKGISQNATDLYNGDKVARKHFQMAFHDPEEYDRLNTAYKQVHGTDATTPQQLAQGWVLSHANKRVSMGEKDEPWKNPNQFQINSNIVEGRQKRMKLFAKSLGVKEGEYDENDPGESMMQALENNNLGNKPLYPAGGGTINANELPATPALKKIFSRQSGVHMVQPDEFRQTANDKNVMGLFFKKDDKGVPIVVNGKHIMSETMPPIIMPREQLKSELLKSASKEQIKEAKGKKSGKKEISGW